MDEACRNAPEGRHLPFHAARSVVQADPRLPEQRIGDAAQVADQRPDPPWLDQPAPATSFFKR